MTKGPVLFDLDDTAPAPRPETAPPVPDIAPVPEGRAMQAAARMAARTPSRLARWFWGLGAALIAAVISVAFWDFVVGLLDRAPLLGLAVAALSAVFLAVCLLVSLRELAGLARLRRVDGLRRAGEAALAGDDLEAARAFARSLSKFYADREETAWGRAELTDHLGDPFDAAAVLQLAEDRLLSGLDTAAQAEVEAAARQVATVTALVPLALADVAAALTANLRMVRRVAEIYGGRAGLMGSWRLTRAVLAHLVATGAVAAGDDLLEPLLGGSLLSKLSRRFGEGLVNGALCARVGVAAMEVCRPMPFGKDRRPRVGRIVQGALGGLFRKGPG